MYIWYGKHNVIWQNFMHFLVCVDSAMKGYETQLPSETAILCETHDQCFYCVI